MNFDFPDDLKAMRDDAARLLRDRGALLSARRSADDGAPFDRVLWEEVAGLGWVGAAVPERFGGSGIGFQALCLLAEEVGRMLAPIPFAASACLAAEALLLGDDDEQKGRWLTKLASGAHIGTVALADGLGNLSPEHVTTSLRDNRLNGTKVAVPDGGIADMAVVVARRDSGPPTFVLVELDQHGVTRERVATIDPMRSHANLTFTNAVCEPLVVTGESWSLILTWLNRAAILTAFEQIGGAQACLDMARDYALTRQAFGRPIGSYQAIKHKLARIFVDIELARSNSYFGAWAATSSDASALTNAACVARISASRAFQHAATENIQTHGGLGFTWESDCQLYYRRAKTLSLNLGSPIFWSDILMESLAPSAMSAEVGRGF